MSCILIGHEEAVVVQVVFEHIGGANGLVLGFSGGGGGGQLCCLAALVLCSGSSLLPLPGVAFACPMALLVAMVTLALTVF